MCSVIGWSWSIRSLITQKGLYLREHTTKMGCIWESTQQRSVNVKTFCAFFMCWTCLALLVFVNLLILFLGSRFHYVKTRGCHLHWVETSTPDPRKRGAQGDSRTSIRRKAARINSPTTHEYLLTGVDIEVFFL